MSNSLTVFCGGRSKPRMGRHHHVLFLRRSSEKAMWTIRKPGKVVAFHFESMTNGGRCFKKKHLYLKKKVIFLEQEEWKDLYVILVKHYSQNKRSWQKEFNYKLRPEFLLNDAVEVRASTNGSNNIGFVLRKSSFISFICLSNFQSGKKINRSSSSHHVTKTTQQKFMSRLRTWPE